MKTQSRPKRGPKQLTAIQTSRHFRVSHRRHSGHVLPRQHTSYPALIMIVLCVGVLLFSWTQIVTADTFVYPGAKQDSYDVHLRVPGPAPSVAASIDTPLDGDIFTDIPISVKGTCPANTYVSISRNNVFSGVGLCLADGTYSVKTGLFAGLNQLRAQVYSQTDVPGPVSNVVTVTYNPPIPPVEPNADKPVATGDSSAKPAAGTTPKSPPAPTKRSTSATTQIEPLLLKTNFTYQGVYTGEPTNWQLDIEGGSGPYALSIDWGDGTNSVISRAQAGAFSLEHAYKKAGGYKGSYTATFTASDADGSKTYLQLLAIVNDPRGGAAGLSKGSGGPVLNNTTPAYLENILKYVWPGYGIVLLMLTSFWLGERRELRYLRPQPKRPPHRHA